MSIPVMARNATLDELWPMLERQQEAKIDAVAATSLRSSGGVLHVAGLSVFDEATIRPTAVMDGHIAERLNIPIKYLRRMREERPDLYDANVNGLIHGTSPTADILGVEASPDDRSFLLRCFLDLDGSEGIGRALLSPTYKPMDNLDVLIAAIEGIQASGADFQIVRCNLSETRMSVRFACPDMAVAAPVLLKGYRPAVEGLISPEYERWRQVAHREGMGYKEGEEPIVFAGFDVDNSETGGGAFSLTPVYTVKICKNGLVINALAVRKIHLGARLDEGQIIYTDDTQRKNMELVAAQTRDTVATFIDPEFVKAQIDAIEEKAGTTLENPEETIKLVATKLSYTEEQRKGILGHFIQGGQMTAGGVLNAVTSYAQTVEDPDVAYEMERSGMEVLALAAA